MAAQAVACPHADTDGLRLAPPGPEELEVAAAMAAIALADSPPYAFACGGSAVAREGVLRTLFARNMWVAHRQGCCWGAYEEEALVCFFMLVPQGVGSPTPSICDLLRSGIFESLLRLGLRATLALARITAWAETAELDLLQGRTVLRLEGMVVRPSRQRQGIGTKALRAALRVADESGLEVFLATQEANSVPFYRRLDFEVVREEAYAPAGFVTWFMLRPVGGAGATA